MADNVTLNPGSGGSVIRTDDVGGGVQVPASKLTLGDEGVDGGFVGPSNPLPVRCHFASSFAITPADLGLAITLNALWIGWPGDLHVTLTGGTNAILQNYPIGWFPIPVTMVWATGTTARNIIGFV